MKTLDRLIKKYDVPVPRYTSYPTMPLWNSEGFDVERWFVQVKRAFDESNDKQGISLYIHLPFCESLCTYCACNTRITKNHSVEERYLEALLKEWDQYCAVFSKPPVIRELHLGGGTPTFFNPENLEKLIIGILKKGFVHNDHEFSFEGHPNNTTREHLQALYNMGFRRVSFGVQDLDEKVQRAINRVQPFERLEYVTNMSREIGYESVSFDLVYGLPYQTTKSIGHTIEKVIGLRPDRIAFYSYAHVPWIKPGQRGYEDADLPGDVEKRLLYETGRAFFNEAGYRDIGMDHFALPHDALSVAFENGKLHRNFMGYTISQTRLLIGLGVSAISDAYYAYAQNEKNVEEYYKSVARGFPVFKGHLQTDEDLLLKQCILNIICKGKLTEGLLQKVMDDSMSKELSVMEDEGILEMSAEGMKITFTGRAFIRNICSVFDKRLKSRKMKSAETFSKSI